MRTMHQNPVMVSSAYMSSTFGYQAGMTGTHDARRSGVVTRIFLFVLVCQNRFDKVHVQFVCPCERAFVHACVCFALLGVNAICRAAWLSSRRSVCHIRWCFCHHLSTEHLLTR